MDPLPQRPRLLRRLASVLRGEVPATELEALRAAGRGVYQVYLDAEQMQVELAGQGTHPFLASRVQRTQLLCTWNAYVLQVLGEALIDGDYRASPVTIGYLPPVTFEQSWACLAQVEPWLARCRRAMDDPSYDLAGDVELPVSLPAWVVVEDYPLNYLRALAHAAAEVGARAAAVLGVVLAAGRPPGERAAQVHTAQGLVAAADSALRPCSRCCSRQSSASRSARWWPAGCKMRSRSTSRSDSSSVSTSDSRRGRGRGRGRLGRFPCRRRTSRASTSGA